MKLALISILILALTGCSSIRQNVGRPLAIAGQNTGKTANVILAASGVSIVLIPVGVALWVPIMTVACPLYYGGTALAGDEFENDAFDL